MTAFTAGCKGGDCVSENKNTLNSRKITIFSGTAAIRNRSLTFLQLIKFWHTAFFSVKRKRILYFIIATPKRYRFLKAVPPQMLVCSLIFYGNLSFQTISLHTQHIFVRLLITCILFFSLIAQLFVSSFVVLDYKLNTRDYTRNCENKTRPQMHCNGKCQMVKKMKEQQEKEEKRDNAKKEFASVLFVDTHAAFLLSPHSFESTLTHHAVYTFGSGANFFADIFHPPSFS